MPDYSSDHARRQRQLAVTYFDESSDYWTQVYEASGVYDVVYQDRLRLALAFVDQAGLSPGSRALDIGSGAGSASVELARRGFTVDAIDVSEKMVLRTRQRALGSRLETRISASIGDIHHLPFPDRSFDLVIALGVLPWLPRIAEPLEEVARVLRRGGVLVITVDHRWGASRLFGRLTSVVLYARKALVEGWKQKRLPRKSNNELFSRTHSIKDLDVAIVSSGFDKVTGVTLGFGPFCVFRRPFLPSPWGVRLHRHLQTLAEQRFPLISLAGSQYIILARRRN